MSLMDAASLAMDFSNIINLVATLLLMRTVIKDRKVLKGFSVSGTFLAWFGILGLEAGFFLLGNFVSFGLGIVGLVFWILAFAFSLRKLSDK